MKLKRWFIPFTIRHIEDSSKHIHLTITLSYNGKNGDIFVNLHDLADKRRQMVVWEDTDSPFNFLYEGDGDKSVRVPMYDYDDENSVKYIDIEFMYYKPTEQVFLFINYNGGRIGFTRLYDGIVIEPYSRFINIVRIVTDICYELERKAHVIIS